MTEKELMEMVAAEEKRLGVGSEEFLQRHHEIMEEAEQSRRGRRQGRIWKS